jgi:hypothetical protein
MTEKKLPDMPPQIAVYSDMRSFDVEAYGRECWNAGIEWAAANARAGIYSDYEPLHDGEMIKPYPAVDKESILEGKL